MGGGTDLLAQLRDARRDLVVRIVIDPDALEATSGADFRPSPLREVKS